MTHIVGVSYLMKPRTYMLRAWFERRPHATSVNTEEFIKRFCKDWLKCLPKPKMVRVDTEGVFVDHVWLNGLKNK